MFFEKFYISIAIIFVIWQGYFYFKWHPRDYTFFSTRHIQEVLLNFSGSLIGWSAGYFLIFNRLFINDISTFNPKFSDFIILIITFYGINGQIPNIMYNKIPELVKLIKK